MFSVSQAASRLGVCIRTIHRWDAAGKLHCHRTIGGHRRIPVAEVNRILGLYQRDLITTPFRQRCAIYARVSRHRQRRDGDLDRQLRTLTVECRKRFRSAPLVLIDVGSGLNMRRKGLIRLFSFVKRGLIHTLLVTHTDRLARFGVDLLERFLTEYNVHIEVFYRPDERSPQEELVTDMMALVVSFSGRVYGLRSHQTKKMAQSS